VNGHTGLVLQDFGLNPFQIWLLPETVFVVVPFGAYMKLWFIAALLFLALFLAVPQATQPDAVLVRLAKVELFGLGPTGYVGVTSAGEKDFRTVQARSSAATDFEKLFAEGNIQAKSYALVGIQKLNPTRFKELARPLLDSKESVTTIEGCIISDEPFTYILKQIGSGKYRGTSLGPG
jgi:hypothetical protein